MKIRTYSLLLIFLLSLALTAACSRINGTSENSPVPAPETAQATPTPPTPPAKFTEADIAKLKWLEGTWRGMDGEKPFYERIKFQGPNMIVETFTDGTLTKVDNTSKFDFEDGEFGTTSGEQRSAASSITDTKVQFIPAPARLPDGTLSTQVKGNFFRFERLEDGTWNAVLDIPASKGKPGGQKVYKMEPWKGETGKR